MEPTSAAPGSAAPSNATPLPAGPIRRRFGLVEPGFAALLAVFLAYGLIFIWRTTFVFGGARRFVLFDDAMISMRFARNLITGHGLAWNPGAPPVEGFTNLLWVLYMAVVHLLPIPEARIALAIQLSGLALLAVNLVYVRRLAERLSGGSRLAVWFALALTAFYLPLNNWTLQGMEVGLLAWLVTAALAIMVRDMDEGRASLLPYILLGVATLVRLDMVVPLVGTAAYLAIAHPGRRPRHFGFALLAIFIFIGGQTLFRAVYYSSLLPNTYYLKLTGYPIGPRIARGARVFLDFAWRFNPILFLLPFAAVVARRRSRRARAPGLLLWIFCLQCLYSVWVGGDAWETWGGANRFICVAMPAFFIVLGMAVTDVYAFLKDAFLKESGIGASAPRALLVAIAAIVLLLMTIQVNLIRGNPTPKGLLLIDKPVETAGNMITTVQALAIRAVTTEEASVAVVWAGSIPYFSHRPSIDLLGRCDARIAREAAHAGAGFYPGHMKWDYAYSIGALKPDVIAQLWRFEDPASTMTLRDIPGDASPHVRGDYLLADIGGYHFLLRKGSPRILWDKVQPFLKDVQF